jgi:hypothetical protein
MTLKQKVHDLVDELPDDSELLHEFCETAELNKALAKSMDDFKHGRVYSEEDFVAKVRELWRENRVSPSLQQALDESQEDVRHGRMYTSEEFMTKVNERWPLESST